jgi:capsular polysaccharide biosynthesis protein
LPQSAFDREHLLANPVMHERLPLARRLDSAFVFVGPWHTNYYHWLTDHLPRLALLALDESPEVPVLVHADLAAWQTETLELLGVPTERMVAYRHPHVRIRRALWPSLPGRTGNTPPWAAEYLRSRLAIPPESTGRLLYVSRGDTSRRQVANEHDVIAELRQIGFDAVNPGELTVREQMQLFGEAKLIVGAHGAGLTNMIASSRAAVVEVIDPSYVNGCFYTLSNALGHRYWYLAGRSDVPGVIVIDIAVLGRTIDAALESLEGPSYTRTQ